MRKKSLYILLNEEFYRLLRPLLLICALNTAGQLLLMAMASRYYPNIADRYESFYVRSGCVILFMISLACVIGLFVRHFYGHYWGSKSIYTLMTLPIKRSRIYLVFLLSYSLSLAFFFLSNILTVIAGYSLFASAQMRFDGGSFFMQNGLFLAFVRSDFLRLLVPVNIEALASSLVLWLSIPITVLYTVISERSLKYWNLLIPGTMLVLMIYTISQRLNGSSPLMGTLATLVISCFCLIKSLYIIKKNSIT